MISDNDWALLYLVVCLLLWLMMEMTGEMSKARKDIIDGTSLQFILIVLWLPALAVLSIAGCFVCVGFLLNKAGKINLWE